MTHKNDRTVFVFNFINETVEGGLPVESSANLRIYLKLEKGVNSPHVIILFADTVGLMTIDHQRAVSCDIRG